MIEKRLCLAPRRLDRPLTVTAGGLGAGGKGASLHLLSYAKQTIIIILLYFLLIIGNISLSLSMTLVFWKKTPSPSCNFWADNSRIYAKDESDIFLKA